MAAGCAACSELAYTATLSFRAKSRAAGRSEESLSGIARCALHRRCLHRAFSFPGAGGHEESALSQVFQHGHAVIPSEVPRSRTQRGIPQRARSLRFAGALLAPRVLIPRSPRRRGISCFLRSLSTATLSFRAK